MQFVYQKCLKNLCACKACYYQCIKTVFGYDEMDSVTLMLLELNLFTFKTVIHKSAVSFSEELDPRENCDLVQCSFFRNFDVSAVECNLCATLATFVSFKEALIRILTVVSRDC